MIRSPSHLLENRREALARRKRDLDAAIADSERRLGSEVARYESMVEHWREGGAAALLSPEERRLQRRARRRRFVCAFAVGTALPPAVAAIVEVLLTVAGAR